MTEKIDLNQADATALASLPGIGKGLAARIVAYRETVHPFAEVIELAAVPGISERMVREIEAQLTVAASEEPEIVEEAPEEEAFEEPAVEEPAPVVEAPLAETAVSFSASEIEEPEPIFDEVVERPLPVPPSAPSRSGFREHLLTAVMGALLGTLLTLAVLWLLNGSLRLNESDQVNVLERQSNETVATMQSDQAGTRGDLDALDEQFSAMSARESDTAVLLETVQSDLANTRDELAETANKTDALESITTDLDERLTAVAAGADNFDAFLNGVRDLLWTLQGPPPTPTATVTPTATATTAVTPTLSITATPFVTRTPRPTATPLQEAAPTALPTATPTE